MPAMASAWPWQANDRLMVALTSRMSGTAARTPTIYDHGAVAAAFQQDWDNQIVVALGLAYRFTMPSPPPRLQPRQEPDLGPVRHYLRPAIAEDHHDGGLGYAFGKQSQINSPERAEVSVTVKAACHGQRRHADRAQPDEPAADAQLHA
jgi:long-chain fatty acid transport protein